jgi:multiple sugar transport system substrate-binding protein
MPKQFSRRDFLALSAGAALGSLLTACEGTPSTPTKAEDKATSALSFWNMPFVTQEVSPQYVQQWEEAVKKTLPNIAVDNFYGPGEYKPQRDKFLLQAKSGTPDVVEGLLEDTAVYVKNGFIDPLDDRFNAWVDKSQFIEAALNPLKINGHLYAIPYNTNARGLVYRQDLLAEYGLQVPTTWPELVETGRKITEKSQKKVYGCFVCTLVGDPRAPQEFISWYYQVSGKKDMFNISSGAPVLMATPDQLAQVLTLYDELFKGNSPACDPNQRGAGWQVEDPGYVAGKWAMCPMGTWLWGRRKESAAAKEILEKKTGIAPLPVVEEGTPATYLEVKPIMLNAFSKNKDLAWELIKFICSKEQMGLWLADSGGIPARKDSLEMDVFTKSDIGWWIQGFAKLLPQSVALGPVNWGPVNEANLKAVNYVIYGEKTPQNAAQWLYNQIKEMEKTKVL